jgi:hypothetical protein
MNYLEQYHEEILALANVGVFMIWLIYAQLFYKTYTRQRKPKLLINQVQGYDLDSFCLITNMSEEPIHIECITLGIHFNDQARVQSSDQTLIFNVSEKERDLSETSIQSPDKLRTLTRQGPLSPSAYVSIGKFRELLEKLIGSRQHMFADSDLVGIVSTIEAIDIRIIADYGSEDQLVGASKRFFLDHEVKDGPLLFPERYETRQKAGWYDRHFVVPRWYRACNRDYAP